MIDVCIKIGIFQGDLRSPLLFITAFTLLPVILIETVQGYRFQQGRKVNHLLYIDGLKLYRKNIDKMEALKNPVRIFTNGIKFGISKCATLGIKRGKKVEEDGKQMQGG